jgi:NADP-dependent 3-hydroxy acid dehydrogenase YdfG
MLRWLFGLQRLVGRSSLAIASLPLLSVWQLDVLDGLAVQCDVTKEADIQAFVAKTETRCGIVDIFFSNTGVCLGEPDHAASAGNDVWQQCWDVYVMAHVYAARAVLPGMIARGDAYLLQMASAAVSSH